jgi:formimidoylglutamate deiminase
MLVLDTQTPGLLGIPTSHMLDALVFATNASAIRDVYVGGKCVVRDGAHTHAPRIAAELKNVMQALWETPDTTA